MEKPCEFNALLYLAFIVYKKAFDSVRHSMLWTVLKKMVVSDVIVKLLRNLYMYSGQQVAVRVHGEVSRTLFTVVHQGSKGGISRLIDALQPLLRSNLSRVGGRAWADWNQHQ